MNRRFSTRRGFTLVEALIATTILALFLLFVFSSMQSMSQASAAGTANVDAAAQNQRVIQQINLDLLQSAMDRVTATPTTLTVQKISGFDDVSGQEVWSGAIAYTRNAQNEVVRTENGVAKVIAGGVTALSFTAGAVDITVTVTTQAGRQSNNTDSQITNTVTVAPKN